MVQQEEPLSQYLPPQEDNRSKALHPSGALLGTARGQEVQIFKVTPGEELPISRVYRPCSSPQEVTSLCWIAHQSSVVGATAGLQYHDSCLLLGLSSGHLQVMDEEDGEILHQQRVHDSELVRMEPRVHGMGMQPQEVAEDVTLTFANAVARISSLEIRSMVAARRRGVSPPPLTVFKWGLRPAIGPRRTTLCLGVKPPKLHSLLTQDMSSLAPTLSIATAGSSPPFALLEADEQSGRGTVALVSEMAGALASGLAGLAKNVVLGRESGYRAGLTTGLRSWLTPRAVAPKPDSQPGSPSSSGKPKGEPLPVSNPSRLTASLVDNPRSILFVIPAPRGTLAVAGDSLGRILLIDQATCLVLRIWKAYRHAQAAWLFLPVPTYILAAPTPSASPPPSGFAAAISFQTAPSPAAPSPPADASAAAELTHSHSAPITSPSHPPVTAHAAPDLTHFQAASIPPASLPPAGAVAVNHQQHPQASGIDCEQQLTSRPEDGPTHSAWGATDQQNGAQALDQPLQQPPKQSQSALASEPGMPGRQGGSDSGTSSDDPDSSWRAAKIARVEEPTAHLSAATQHHGRKPPGSSSPAIQQHGEELGERDNRAEPQLSSHGPGRHRNEAGSQSSMQLCLILHVPRKQALEIWPSRPGPRILRIPCSPDLDLIPSCAPFGSSFAPSTVGPAASLHAGPQPHPSGPQTCLPGKRAANAQDPLGLGSDGDMVHGGDLERCGTQQTQSAPASQSSAAENEPFAGSAALRENAMPAAGEQLSGSPGNGFRSTLPWQPQLIGVSRHTARVTDLAAELGRSLLELP
ncbi:hypothetical protein WJX74_011113 [Apatococcus lobatus]|uniref:Rab3-GAP regulatory subunit N-terminal domain-containing protein n=1 Tax=Apatococcus lobatus TaxID=904363 RepID=A0AAW1QUH2_9CHLO